MSRNAYATLAEYKSFVTARGQTPTTDATDDAVVESLLEQASRYIDNETGRVFYPFVQARYFNVPNSRELPVDEDLLEVVTLTNGDNTTMPTTEYYLVPKNVTPAYAVKITDVSAYTWISNSVGSLENAVSVLGIWGYHDRYSGAWVVGSTLAEDLDVSEVEFDVASSVLFAVGQTIRVGNEIGSISIVATGKITVTMRGDNGSTAATHTSGTSVYIWQPVKTVNVAVLEMARTSYHRRFNQTTGSIETVTASGVVLSPRDVPSSVQAFINTHKSML